jgi:hypothetical protein
VIAQLRPGATERELDIMPWYRTRAYLEEHNARVKTNAGSAVHRAPPNGVAADGQSSLSDLAAAGFSIRRVK